MKKLNQPIQTASRWRGKQGGMFVIEALISVLLFAIGIVGMMIVSAQGVNQVGQSKARNDASYLAGELIGDLWVSANPGATPAVNLSDVDISAWNTKVINGSVLPLGSTALVTYPTNTRVEIDIAWPDSKNQGVQHHYRTAAEIAKD